MPFLGLGLGLGIMKAGGAGAVGEAGPPPLDTGWLNFAGTGSFVNDGGAGTPWASTGNALTSDFNRASVFFTSQGQFSELLEATDLAGTPVPGGATIVGIEARIEVSADQANFVGTRDLQLIVGGVGGGVDKSLNTRWPAANVYLYFGGSNDLWGRSPGVITDVDINGATFGFQVSAQMYVTSFITSLIDHMQMKIYYTV